MSPNEFTDKDDTLGFLHNEPEPFEFLSEDNLEKVITTADTASYEFEIFLSKKKNSYERQPYTIFALLGDFGGFNGAILGFASFFLSFYSSRMFSASLLEDLPVR